MGSLLRGHIDPWFGHQVNNLTVGHLGRLEILLMCYDDGDVVAYYTRKIAMHIERHSAKWNASPPPHERAPQPFFHETVGDSAWGLAIHKQSRLIAVSTNMHEVIVFAFALSPPDPGGRSPDGRTGYDVPPHDEKAPMTWSGLDAVELEDHLRARDRDWTILLPMSHYGNNMPSIGFADDKTGNAEKVVAVDILGCCWIMDIWNVGSRPVRIVPPNDAPPRQRMGRPGPARG